MRRILAALSLTVMICLLLAGCGEGSSTPTGVPYYPGIIATAGNGQVTLSLTAAQGGPSVDSFTVYYSTTDSVMTSSSMMVAGITGTSTTITGLSNGTMYYFIATAVNAYGESPSSVEVRAMPEINIGAVTILASGLSNPFGIAIDSASVYWTEDGSTPYMSGPGVVKKVGINGGIVTTLYLGLSGFNTGPRGIAVDSTSVYWTDTLNETVNKVLISGGTVTTLASIGGGVIAVDSTSAYWSDGIGIEKVGKNGGIVTTLATGTINPYTIAVDSANVYWADSIGIEKVGKNGGIVTTLVSGLTGCPTSIAVDSTSVYWTDMCSWTVNKVGINGGAVTTLASGSYSGAWNGPYGIAVDSTNVYWTEQGSGTIMKASK